MKYRFTKVKDCLLTEKKMKIKSCVKQLMKNSAICTYKLSQF